LDCHFSYIPGRLDPEHRYTSLDKILEEITVIAGHLDDLRALIQSEAVNDHRDIIFGMLEPVVGIRGEIGVLRENLFRTDELLKLNQETVSTDVNMKGVIRFHHIQMIFADVAFAQWRHAKVNERS
jgi:hypothetical protein